jgi:8-oxo-dGTP pyrophosphatase MutT (NUDIX family)
MTGTINRIRSGALVLKDGKILLYQRPAGYWYFPGGKIEPGETVEGCAIRETMEETGARIRLQRLLYVREYARALRPHHTLEFVHLAKYLGGKLRPGHDPEDKEQTKVVEWVPLSNLRKIWFLSPDLISTLRLDMRTRFRNTPRYLGLTKVKIPRW